MVFIKDHVEKFLNPDEQTKKEDEQKLASLQQMKSKVFGTDEKLAMGKGPINDNTARTISTVKTVTKNNPVANNLNQSTNSTFNFNANADENNLGSLDIATELPKLKINQIATIISKHFPNSTVIKPSDAQGIYDAQMASGMSALALLAIGGLESGWGTSSIAKDKNNIWGWNATNRNPGGDATTFSQMSEGARDYANAFMNTYYDGYGAKSINSVGTGNNPSGKGYAYLDDEITIDLNWAPQVNDIMRTLYRTAKEAY